MGCLLLIALQQAHEAVLFHVSRNRPSFHLGLFSVFLLTVALSCTLGLYRRNRKAWWVAVLAMAGFGLLHAAVLWTPVKNALEPLPPKWVNAQEYEWIQPFRLSPFGVFWVVARGILLLLVPALLLLGELRKALKSP